MGNMACFNSHSSFKEMNPFIQQWYIKLIKGDEDIYNVSISNKYCSFELLILKKNLSLFQLKY